MDKAVKQYLATIGGAACKANNMHARLMIETIFNYFHPTC